MTEEYRYRAFISYSHRDEYWARWLHRALETYRVPKHLVGRETPQGPVPARLAPVFRDRDELASATSLGETLSRALRESQYQLVICSAAAAKSRWVNEEILTFKRLGREGRIFCLLVDGEPGASLVAGMESLECFPPVLLFTLGADGELTSQRAEPIAADVRPHKDGKADARLKLIAGMLGVGLDELKQREAHRRRRRLTVMLAASTVGMAITSTLAVAAWLARNDAERQRVRAQQEAETARQTTQFMVGLFKVSDPSEALGNSITAREILDKGAARIDSELTDQPAIQATLMDTIGTVYTSLGLYDSAVPLIQQAVAKRRGLLGSQSAPVADSLNNLGSVLMLKASYTEAQRNLSQALEIRRAIFGGNSAPVAETLTSLADIMSALGEYARGTPLIEEALRIRSSLYGEHDPLVAESMGDLAQNLGELGDFGKSEPLLRRVVALQRELHPAGHPAVTEAINNLAWALMNLGQADKAEPLFREALDAKRKVLGTAHPELAAGLNNLAFAREMRHDYAGAEAAYLEALAMNRKLLGERHPEVARNMSNLAFVQYAEGKHRQAINLLSASLDLRRETLGAMHPDVAGGAASLGFWLIDTGNLAQAKQLIDESLDIRRRALGEEHPGFATTLSVQASLLLAQRRFAAAADTAARAEQILKPTQDASRWQMAMAMNVHGAALTGLRQYDAAEKLLRASLAGLDGAPIPGLKDKGRLRMKQLYEAWGKMEQASQFTHQ